MGSFSKKIAPSIIAQFEAAHKARTDNDSSLDFRHLENAHVLGQASTYWHTLVHLKMLAWSVRNRVLREFFGQIFRIIGAATKTAFGLIPEGNTGGANISPFKSLPIAAEFSEIIQSAKK